MSKKKKELPQEVSLNAGSMGISIAELLGRAPAAPVQNKEKAPQAKGEEKVAEKKSGKISRWSLQRQTAGRGGKVVTLVVFPKDSAVDLESVAKQMRRGLGCGSHVEENKIVLQGDIAERAQTWLEKNSG